MSKCISMCVYVYMHACICACLYVYICALLWMIISAFEEIESGAIKVHYLLRFFIVIVIIETKNQMKRN